MQRCITSASYAHVCDVYSKEMTYDEDSGSMDWSWIPSKQDVPCMARPFVDGGIKGGGTMEKFDTESYISSDYIKVKTGQPLVKSERVTNVRAAATGNVIWMEEELDSAPTIFNVEGCSPVPNVLTGEVSEYISVLSRAQSQGMGGE